MMALTCSVKNALLIFNPLFTVHKSFKNLAYVGTCLLISKRGMTFTCLNTARISVWFFTFFFLLVLEEMEGQALLHHIFFNHNSLWFLIIFFFIHFKGFRHWLLNLFTTPLSDDFLYFIYIGSRLTGRGYFMNSPMVWLCM